ncbi:MAG: histidine phosphatase family protein [Actinomycetales bacterium]
MTRLILVRHAQTYSNVDGLLDTGYPGAGLTELGRAQADQLVVRLDGEPVDAIHVSNLVRTQLTAAPLAAARGLAPQQHEGLREIEAGAYEMAGDRDSISIYRDVIDAWCQGDLSPRFAGGESGSGVLERVDVVVDRAVEQADSGVALFSHGAVLRVWAANRAANLPTGFAYRHPLHNTDVIILDRDGTDWLVRTWSHINNIEAGVV